MQIDPKHLIQLAEILDCGSFTVAARRLNTSQPALSRMASDLEARLGAQIFASRRNPVTPTALGRELANYGRSVRASTEHVARLADRVAAGEQGELTIGVPPFHSERVVSRFLADWLTRYTDVRIVLHNDYAPVLLTKLINGYLDLILAPVEVIEGTPNLIVERLTQGGNVIVCRAGHPLLAEPRITATMLSQARWISHGRDSLLHRDTRMALTSIGVEYIDLPAFESSSAGAIHTIVAGSDMLTVLPELVAADLVGSGGYAILPFELPGPFRPFGYITHEGRQTPALRAFRDDLRTYLLAVDARARSIRRAQFRHDGKDDPLEDDSAPATLSR